MNTRHRTTTFTRVLSPVATTGTTHPFNRSASGWQIKMALAPNGRDRPRPQPRSPTALWNAPKHGSAASPVASPSADAEPPPIDLLSIVSRPVLKNLVEGRLHNGRSGLKSFGFYNG